MTLSLLHEIGGYLVAGHHGSGAVQRLPSTGEVRADGDSDSHGAGRLAVVRLVQRQLPREAVVGVRQLDQLGVEEGSCAALHGGEGVESSLDGDGGPGQGGLDSVAGDNSGPGGHAGQGSGVAWVGEA